MHISNQHTYLFIYLIEFLKVNVMNANNQTLINLYIVVKRYVNGYSKIIQRSTKIELFILFQCYRKTDYIDLIFSEMFPILQNFLSLDDAMVEGIRHRSLSS